jgi:ABC-type uncharacterized transport system involved in gliding motility auxiliary subunit
MQRVVDFLAPVGFAIMAGAYVLFNPEPGRAPALPGQLNYYLIAGALLIVVHLVLRSGDIVRAIGGRQVRYGGNTLLLAVASFVILAGINWLGVRHSQRWDLTKTKRHSLSEQTRKLLAGLKDEVQVTYFAIGGELFRGEDRFRVYQALTPKLKVEFIDPMLNPVKTQNAGVRGPWPTIVFESGDRKERITTDMEQDITNALIKLQRTTKKSVCFAEGSGERDTQDESEPGLATARKALQEGAYEVKKVNLLTEDKVPGDCSVFIMAGPSKDPLPASIDKIRAHVNGGGKFLLMLEPEIRSTYPNLVALLKEWNIEAGADVVLEPNSLRSGLHPFWPITLDYPYHEITKDLAQGRVPTVFQLARSMKAGSATIENVTVQNLAQTSPDAWAETDVKGLEKVKRLEDIQPPGPDDTFGPLPLAAAMTRRIPDNSPDAKPEDFGAGDKEARVVAIGDVDFAANHMRNMPGNQDFFMNSVAWLSHDTDLISIRPTEASSNRLFLTQGQRQYVWLLAKVLIPGAFVVAGIVSWWRRR